MDLTAVVPTLMQLLSWRSFSLEMKASSTWTFPDSPGPVWQGGMGLCTTWPASQPRALLGDSPEAGCTFVTASKDPRSSRRETVQLTSTKWGATALTWVRYDPDLPVQWKANSPARERSRCGQSNPSRLVATSMRYQKPLPSLRCRLNHSCMSRLGTPSTLHQARSGLWSSTSAMPESQDCVQPQHSLPASLECQPWLV